MASLEEKERWRIQLLDEVYDRSDGRSTEFVEISDVVGVLEGATGPDAEAAAEYLSDEGLLDYEGGAITELRLSPEGVRAVEERRQPDVEAAEAVAVLTDRQIRDVEAFLGRLAREKDTLALSEGDERALELDMKAVEDQTKSPRPNRGIVRASLRAIGWLIKEAGGGAAGQALFVGAVELARAL